MDDLEKENKIIKERYQVLPEDIKEIIEYGLLDKIILTIKQDHQLDEEKVILLENHLMLILLLLLPSYNINTKLMEILNVDEFRASLIGNYLKSELFYLIEDILEVTDEKFLLNESKLDLTSNTSPVLPYDHSNDFDKVLALRTLETDARRIHGYGAFRGAEPKNNDQPVYHSEQAKLVPPPSYTDDSSPPRAS